MLEAEFPHTEMKLRVGAVEGLRRMSQGENALESRLDEYSNAWETLLGALERWIAGDVAARVARVLRAIRHKDALPDDPAQQLETALRALGSKGGGNRPEKARAKLVKRLAAAFESPEDRESILGGYSKAWERLWDAFPALVEARILEDPTFGAKVCSALGWPRPFSLVLRDEIAEVDALRARRDPTSARPAPGTDIYAEARDRKLVGLAFSGGGIRSATFNLGVLQGLATLDLLNRFDYLSTVSGGGYIGSWLGAWTHRNKDFEFTTRALIPAGPLREVDKATEPIGFLRKFSNYLTPQLGIFSADTWTMVTVYVRNLILMLAILVACIATALLVPRMAIYCLSGTPSAAALNAVVIAVVVLIFFALSFVIANLNYATTNGTAPIPPGANTAGAADALLTEWPPREKKPPFYVQQGWIQLLAIVPVLVASFLLAKYLLVESADSTGAWDSYVLITFGGICATSALLAQSLGGFVQCYLRSNRNGMLKACVFMVVFALTCGAAGAGLLWLYLKAARALMDLGHQGLLHFVVWGPPALLVVLGLTGTLLVGLMGLHFPDSGREWFGRFGAWVSIYTLAWLALFAGAIYGPVLVAAAIRERWVEISAAAVIGWIGTTIASIVAAQSPTTGETADGRAKTSWLDLVAKTGPPVFLVGFVVLIGSLLDFLISKGRLDASPEGWTNYFAEAWTHHWEFIAKTEIWPSSLAAFVNWPFEYILPMIGVFLIVTVYLAWRVDINEFSMHHFYKNRLVRCYLGASHPPELRKPNPFTGFDEKDDVNLKKLRPSGIGLEPNADAPYTGPYPIINAALNYTAGGRLAWQERMAASFVFTPRYCGFDASSDGGRSAAFGQQKQKRKPQSSNWLNVVMQLFGHRPLKPFGFRRTEEYAYPNDGIGLGTALAISGAAVNPNQGYHTSLFVAFLLTVFNVRLGWWLGNPRNDDASRRSSPPLGLLYLVKELFGFANDRANYVSVSDGGHFENLGIYELVRRRCAYIVACDAEQDSGMTFNGLANAVRKCRTDFDVEIDVDPSRIARDTETGRSRTHCVVGAIRYPDGTEGTLIYLKASLTGEESTDVLEYASSHTTFPHESTGDQWFDESQFECYRKLGTHIATTTFAPADHLRGNMAATHPEILGDVFKATARLWSPASDRVERNATTHTRTYAALMEVLRSNPRLAFLDRQLFSRSPLAVPPIVTEQDTRDGFYFCVSLIQLLEDIWVDFKLEDEAQMRSPHVEGWMRLYGAWIKRSQMLQTTWDAVHETYGTRFQSFWKDLEANPNFDLK
jgi:hypothetical protein